MIVRTCWALHQYIIRPHIPKSLTGSLWSYGITRILQIQYFTRIALTCRRYTLTFGRGNWWNSNIKMCFVLHSFRSQRPQLSGQGWAIIRSMGHLGGLKLLAWSHQHRSLSLRRAKGSPGIYGSITQQVHAFFCFPRSWTWCGWLDDPRNHHFDSIQYLALLPPMGLLNLILQALTR